MRSIMHTQTVAGHYMVVCVAKKTAPRATFAELKHDMVALVAQLPVT